VTDLAGVVLAAGLGTRLRPLTEILPKALCPVANVPLVDLALERLRAVDGVDDLAVNVHHHRERMVEHLTRPRPGPPAAVHLSVEEPEALGTAGALAQLKPWIDGRATIVHNADAWFAGDIPPALADGWDGETIRLLVVEARPGDVDFDGRWTFAGVSLLPWSSVEPLQPEPTGLWEVSWQQAWHEGRVEVVPLDPQTPWFDTGTPATYLAANLAAAHGRSVVHPTADVHPTATLDQCVVWADATVHAGEHLHRAIRASGDVTVRA
jgi:N-acetyl-alpha-D-muramate 1-phosphate uridylyltransferase